MLSGVLTSFRIAWRNLGRNRRRTVLAVGAVSLGQFTLVFVNSMMAGAFDDMLDIITGPLIGHVQIHHAHWRDEQAVDLLINRRKAVEEALKKLPRVKTISSRIFSPVLAASGEDAGQAADAWPAMVVGVDPAVESARGGLIEMLPAEQRPKGYQAAIGKVLANRLNIRPGQSLALIGQDVDGFPVSDLFEVTGIVDSTIELVQTMGIVLEIDTAGAFLAMEDQVHEIIVRAPDQREAEDLARRIAALPGLKDYEVLPWREVAPQLAGVMDLKSFVDLFFVGILFVAAAAGIANTMMMSTFERTRELGMLLALGTQPKRIVAMILIEAVMLGLVGVALGSLIGAVTVYITSYTGIDYGALGGMAGSEIVFHGLRFSYVIYPQFELRHVGYGTAAVILTSVITATWPAALAVRLQPAEAMRS